MAININSGVVDVNYSEEMRESYLQYALSVIKSRALPDARDGLKPVQRRVLYAMGELSLNHNRPHKKSARVVGDVLGKYHPHGDSSVYEAMVRLAQDFNVRYKLVDGHGNFGSIDGDSAAAQRYTETRLSKMGQYMLRDIHKETVPFRPNFDESLEEPEILPTLIPYSLLSGINGIAVGMATNMAPYNITKVYDALDYMIDQELKGEPINESEALDIIGLPDFPTGGVIVNYTEAKEAVKKGRGRIIVRSKYHIEERRNGTDIIITEIPYQVNKTKLIKNINDKREELTAIREVRDESTKDIRIVIELKKNAQINLILNTLFKTTQLQSTFSINNTVLNNDIPIEATTFELLEIFLEHSKDVITNRTNYDLNEASSQAHIKEGIIIALNNIDRIIEIIQSSSNDNEVKEKLNEEFDLSEEQSRSIIATRLGTLMSSSREKIEDELAKLNKSITLFRQILENEDILLKVLKVEYNNLKEELGDEVRTEIDYNADPNIDIDDLIKDETLIITYTTEQLIKSMPEKAFKSQNRGGKGSRGLSLSDEDIVESLYTLNSKDDLLFITDQGKCYKLKAYDIEKSTRNAKGKYIGNYLDLEENEQVLRMIPLNLEEKQDDFLIFVTKQGMIKKLQVSDLGVRNARVITFREGDYLVDCFSINEDEEKVMITSNTGNAIMIDTKDIRATGRTAIGVTGIKLEEDEHVNSMLIVNKDSKVLTIAEKGLGKVTDISEFSPQNRGGKGVRYYRMNKKSGEIVKTISVNHDDEVLVITREGISIRLKVSDLTTTGRNATGSKIINVGKEDKVISITAIVPDIDEEELEEEE